MRMRFGCALLVGVFLCGPLSWGKIRKADYERADALRDKVKDLVYKTTIEPHWFDENRKFWYRNDLRDGREFILVECEKGTRQEAFDHEKLAQSLSEQTGNKYTARTLPFTAIRFSEDGKSIEFEIEKPRWTCDLTTYECKPLEEENADQDETERAPRQRRRPEGQQEKSPDEKWETAFKDHNLFLRSTEDDREFRLSHDGKQGQYYSSAMWSPDSRWIVAYRTIPGTNGMVYLIESSPNEGGRAVFHSHQYDLPGDTMTSYEMSVFSVETKEQIRVDAEAIDFQGPPRLRWARDNLSFTYHKTDRGHQRLRVLRVFVETGKIQTIIDEKSETFINEWWGGVRPAYLEESNEVVWPSERDGWMHLYLYDSREGKLKHQITSGSWVVRRIGGIDDINEQNRTIVFQACGKEPGQDPYFLHYYRIHFDGTGLVCLTPGNGTHQTQYSPDKKVLIDTYSRVDLPPVHELRRADTGELLCELEKADASALYEMGWRHPEPFVAKGRDGKTDIYGIIHRPMKLNESKKIPIIEQIYAGPHGSFVPKDWNNFYSAQLISELGFIVVQIDGMGTNHRGKAFHDVCYKNVGDAGLPDRILWIQAAAEKYTYMDTSRVGIYGTSAGGQSSTGAVLSHPEFYDVAVSSCGCHDNRMDKASWNEQWMGYPVGPHYEEQSNITNAHKLQGHLMLFVGELDRNVPPESTYRLANALIKAGKEFELVVLPGTGHTDGGSYGLRKRRDFFVKHLWGVNPPNWNSSEQEN
ncbi:MAG: prolyl oligopeptidase family serine peptidase [Sedimentisphaerales bacterium]|nr:prolyl oligopeptidase family serine peptidase [Sedimentisphaerales bacterium]